MWTKMFGKKSRKKWNHEKHWDHLSACREVFVLAETNVFLICNLILAVGGQARVSYEICCSSRLHKNKSSCAKKSVDCTGPGCGPAPRLKTYLTKPIQQDFWFVNEREGGKVRQCFMGSVCRRSDCIAKLCATLHKALSEHLKQMNKLSYPAPYRQARKDIGHQSPLYSCMLTDHTGLILLANVIFLTFLKKARQDDKNRALVHSPQTCGGYSFWFQTFLSPLITQSLNVLVLFYRMCHCLRHICKLDDLKNHRNVSAVFWGSCCSPPLCIQCIKWDLQLLPAFQNNVCFFATRREIKTDLTHRRSESLILHTLWH